jgi:hypothetical protein
VRHRKQDPQFPKVGDRDAKKTYMTRFLSLGKLIRKYNGVLTTNEAKYSVNEEVVHIRAAFAHGSLVTPTELPARLWKFGTSKNGRVAIEFSEELSLDWLKSKALMIAGEKDKVVGCFNARGYEGLSK